ncbi:MAG: DUF2442 domain-containing protein [Nitrospinae bacterium]|nr:DUF2442 domain-containing protein [Nitrospinota bacterium]
MLKDITEVRPLTHTRIFLRFEDGVEGDLDLSEFVRFDGVFEPLKNPEEFAKVQVHPELKTIVWPCGADLDPDVLYSRLTGKHIPSLK